MNTDRHESTQPSTPSDDAKKAPPTDRKPSTWGAGRWGDGKCGSSKATRGDK